MSSKKIEKDRVNILIVDDDGNNLLSLEQILAPLDENIFKAQSGVDALRQILNEKFALILLDVNMPEMNGLEVASLLRRKNESKGVPIIFVTGHERSDNAIFRGYELGAVDYLVKPIQPEIVLSKARVFVDLFRKTRDLERQRRELERSNHLLEQFAYVASHDLKTPLRHIGSYISLLREAMDCEDKKQAYKELEGLERSSMRMESLVDDVITFSRVSSRKKNFEEVSLEEITKTALSELTPIIEDKLIDVTVGEMPRVRGDKTLLGQVFQNLIGNACKYSRLEQPKIEILCTSSKGVPTVTVKDNGIGFDSSAAMDIFEPFKRLVGKDEYEGSGIGLSICKTAIEHHGGRIWVESTPGVGSQFSFTLANGVHA